MNRKISSLFVFACLLAVLAVAAPKVEKLPSLPNGIPNKITDLLEPNGFRVTDDSGNTVCDVWLRKQIPVKQKTDLGDVLYSELEQPEFVGVISYPNSGETYRGQKIPPGTYVLRYALEPNDGNHLGTAPSRDFLLLTKFEDDPDPTVKLDSQALMTASGKAIGQKHPAVLSLVESSNVESTPEVTTEEEDPLVLHIEATTASGSKLRLALVVKGRAQQ